MIIDEPTGQGVETSQPAVDLGAASTVVFRERVSFVSPDGHPVHIPPGAYRVRLAGQRSLHLENVEGGEAIAVAAAHGGHEFEVRAPLALAVPDHYGHECVVVLLPGGLAVMAGGDSRTPIESSAMRPILVEVLLKWLPFVTAEWLPIGSGLFDRIDEVSGRISPSHPTPFALMTTAPPNSIGEVVVQSFEAPFCTQAGGVASPSVLNIYNSTCTVTVDSSIEITGRPARLEVTYWMKGQLTRLVRHTYQQISSGPGPVVFPGVIVAAAAVRYGTAVGSAVEASNDLFRPWSWAFGYRTNFMFSIHNIRLDELRCRFSANGGVPQLASSHGRHTNL